MKSLVDMDQYEKIGIVGSRRRSGYQDLKKINDVFLLNFKEGDKIVSAGIRSGLSYSGAMNIKDLQKKAHLLKYQVIR